MRRFYLYHNKPAGEGIVFSSGRVIVQKYAVVWMDGERV